MGSRVPRVSLLKDSSMEEKKGLRGQLTLRGIVIGTVGCIIITAASIYTALKMGALPWPIIFAALISLFFLRLFGSRSLNEANVTHTIMSAGAMVAGGLAFTIPGIWIVGLGEVSFWQMLLTALAGTLLGLVASYYFRRRFVVEQALEFPIGRAAAETLKAGDQGGSVGVKLFAAMAFSGLWAFLRDKLALIPSMIGTLPLPGVSFGIFMSPMMVSVGFLVGTGAMVAWFGGAVVQLLLVAGGTIAGLFTVDAATALNSSLGMGVMMGCGIAVICKDVIPKGIRTLRKRFDEAQVEKGISPSGRSGQAVRSRRMRAGIIALIVAVVSYGICLFLGIGALGSAIVVLFSFITVAMSAQSVGQTGIDPMEIFGLIVLLFVALLGDAPAMQLFFVAAVIAVACGLGGDVMNDFKAGHLLGTSPQAQIAGQAIGGILGAVISAGALFALVSAWGPESFGLGREFVSAQANVVATLISGIPNMAAFIVGLAGGFVIYCLRGPSMMIGLGIYLPFYMSLTAFLGCLVKWVVDGIRRKQLQSLSGEECQSREEAAQQSGLVIASGLLGGESVVGVCLAIAALFV